MADYKQAEPERKKKEQAKLQKKIKEGLKEFKPQKKVVEDPEFVGKRKQVLEVIDVAVALGLKKLQQKVAKKPWSKEENSDSD